MGEEAASSGGRAGTVQGGEGTRLLGNAHARSPVILGCIGEVGLEEDREDGVCVERGQGEAERETASACGCWLPRPRRDGDGGAGFEHGGSAGSGV